MILKPQREEMGENAEKIRLAKAMEKLEKQRNDIHREVLGMYLNEVKRFDAGKL